MFKRLKKYLLRLAISLEYGSPVTVISDFLVKKSKKKALILSLIFGLPEFLLITILFLDRMDQMKHGLDVILMVYLASAWAWIGPVMIWKYERGVVPDFLNSVKNVIRNKKDYAVFLKKHKRTMHSGSMSKLYILSWVSFVSYVFINSYPYMNGFGLNGTDDPYWILMVLGVAFYAYLTANGFLLVVKTMLMIKDILPIEVDIDPYHSDDRGGLAFIGGTLSKTTLMFASGALYIPAMLKLYFDMYSSSTPLPVIIVTIYVIMVFLSFLYPVFLFHRKISTSKGDHLIVLAYQINLNKKIVRDGDSSVYPRYVTYRDEYAVLSKLNTWPFDTNDFSTFSFSFILPVILTLAQINPPKLFQ